MAVESQVTLVDDPGPKDHHARVRLAVLWLTIAGTVAGLLAAALKISLTFAVVSAGVSLVLPMASLSLVLLRPELFDKPFFGRGLNPLIAAPAVALCTCSFTLDVTLVDPSQAFVAAAVGCACGVAISGMVVARQPRLAGRLQFGVTVAVIGALYAYGALLVVDINADGSPARLVHVPLMGKHVEQGSKGGSSQVFDLPAWGPGTEPRSVVVDQSTYDALQPGDSVCLLLHPGTLGVAWYEVGLPKAARTNLRSRGRCQ